MGEIKLGRVDHRLIHGQVMTKWSKGLGINAIFIIDDALAKDDFMKDIFISSGKSAGLHVDVFSQDEALTFWQEQQFGDYQVMILFKTVQTAYDVIKKGLPVNHLNLGGVAKKTGAEFVIPSVALVEQEYDQLKELAAGSTDVFFQTVPDTPKVGMKEADKKFFK
ncbi:MAG: PTS sugar transporter subunit IIB [Lactobacillus sp.]|jgi:PTS system mannose-specific IIB component|nr:PTS sugar transporter subunit IIB [Lactobacillus sp.]MCI2033419.1 PTS sugar transporter subunit IIB [Lactobacillus sp.]